MMTIVGRTEIEGIDEDHASGRAIPSWFGACKRTALKQRYLPNLWWRIVIYVCARC